MVPNGVVVATSANLVLIYGSPATTGTLDGQADYLAQPAAITSLSLDPAVLSGPGYPARLRVATNKDNLGGLRYRYTATGGRFTGSGPQVLWIAPENQGGAFTLTVTVLDSTHDPVSQEITATVPSTARTVTGNVSFNNFS